MRHRKFASLLGACTVVAALMISGHLAGAFRPMENQILGVFLAGNQWSGHLPRAAQMAIIAFMCIVPVLVRMEQPLVMLAYGSGIAFMYFLIFSVVLLALNVALPVTASMLGLACTSVAVEMQAWGEERQRRKSLERLERSKQQFTDMLVHDLKRRMSSILMSLDALEQRAPAADERSRELMAAMRASADRMLLLTGNLLDVRRMEEARMNLRREPVALRAIVQESVKDVRTGCLLTGAAIRIEGREDAVALLDRGVFLRVLANLLWNAIQHTRGGEIEVAFGIESPHRAFLHVANRGRTIPKEDQARIFQAFASAESHPEDSRAASTGLGLTFCKLAVEAHGGAISLESPWPPHDDGVRVRILLPLAP